MSSGTFETAGVEETLRLGEQLGGRLSRGDCVALIGPLGAGKTVLVRGIAVGLGLEDPRLVSSPTFVLVHEYPARVPVYHLDLYRLTDPRAELVDLGLEEMLDEGVALVEWADRAAGALPADRRDIRIEITGVDSRRFHVSRAAYDQTGKEKPDELQNSQG